MEQIEVNIKIAANNKIYNIPIRKSDSILKLKEYCKILSNIPQCQQNLLYKGKLLLDDKLINDYNIENNQNILLVQKNESNSANDRLEENSDRSNFSNNNIIFPDNKKINWNEVSNAYKQIPDFISFFNNKDLDKLNNLFQSEGIESFSNVFGVDPQKFKEFLKDPLGRDMA